MLKTTLGLLMMGTTAFANTNEFQERLKTLAAESDGRVGICIWDFTQEKPTCINGDQRFQLQSVMKLVVAAAVMDRVDLKLMQLNELIVVQPEDASPGPQDFANLVRSKGSVKVPIEDLIQRSVVDSDSTSVDILLKHIGGPKAVQKFLQQNNLKEIRIDRNERDVQADSVGLKWKSAFANTEAFESAVKALPEKDRDAAWTEHLKDDRDTSTPLAMASFLKLLASGKLLSEASTTKLIGLMKMTKTGPDRLMAGAPKEWSLAHRTGTGRTWKGVNAATNDVGVLFAPDGRKIALAAFVVESKRSGELRANIIAKAARLAVASSYFDFARSTQLSNPKEVFK
jgi:beta-lactamase class A